MTLPAATTSRATLAEYLHREQQATDRHEFHDGEVLAMSGGTYTHSLISANLIIALGRRLEGGPCRALESNMRIASKATRRYVYPDVAVICEEPQFDPDDPNQTTILNPRVVCEVLSASTEAYDRGEKFNHYRRVPSLREYVLVAQDRPLVETFLRQADGTWSLKGFEGADAVAQLRSLEIDMPLPEIYANVRFDRAAQDANHPAPDS